MSTKLSTGKPAPVCEAGVSYYGISYPEHAERDFLEMKSHHCNAVILALSEFDIDFWFPNIIEVTRVAKKHGLRVYLDTWGIGKWFGGEPPSKFLTDHAQCRQVSAFTGEPLPAACFVSTAFREYFNGICEKLARYVEADGFFWDEPHYALPKNMASITGGAGEDWACRCSCCQEKFKARYGMEMPKLLTPEVVNFREDEALDVLREASRRIKAIRPESEITCCVHATLNTYYVTERRGYDNWEKVASSPEFDVFSTTIIAWNLPKSFFDDITRRTVEVAKKYGKRSQRWMMGYYKQPDDLEEIVRTAKLYRSMGVDSLFTWTYRGGKGTVLAAPDADGVWEAVGRANHQFLTMKMEEDKK